MESQLMPGQSVQICICAGEASGDTLGAALINELNNQNTTQFSISAMGGKKMRTAGADIIVDSTHMGIIGAWEIIKHLGAIIKSMRKMKKYMRECKPKCIILIDYPGMNLRFAKYAHQRGIKVLYYVSPQVWAWRRGRLKQMRKNIDHMAVLFPFEEKFYTQAGMAVSFVGHPLIANTNARTDKLNCYQELNLDPSRPVLALLPGSRSQEIQRLLPTINATVLKLKSREPTLQFILICANSIDKKQLKIDHSLIKTTTDMQAALSVADAAICASGTATLEVALYKVPLVVIYKVAWLTYFLGKLLIKIKHIGLCNIVTENIVAKELIQSKANSKNISHEVLNLLNDSQYRTSRKHELQSLRQQLASGGGSHEVVHIIQKLIGENSA